ncbi:hypothetical protein [Avibacterium paragallinarum]|uniref:hypothetical protein n=3 Tax=Avibacterium paragallinarum TaxID=728 RepID=UPI000614B712|nr:hypothetical protein [Avibacterium paragallinarum]KKB00573.1 hypothetical protein Z012_11305 [Avibacterium paragallinarum]QZP15692.1 hypothetical protein K5O18_13350 [Avibacterium paragallinarum]RZN71718.1 hypothetical protein EIG77_06835 [Avibacterium paragallinarum]
MNSIKKYTVILCLFFVLPTLSFAQDIGLTVSQFAKRVNTNLASIESPFRLNESLKIEKGSVNDVASYQFSDNFSVVITVDKKTHKVKGVMTNVLPRANGGNQNLIMFFSNSALLSAFDSKNAMKTVGKKFINLTTEAITEWSESKKDVMKSFIMNGKKYGISINSYTGVMSFAEIEE